MDIGKCLADQAYHVCAARKACAVDTNRLHFVSCYGSFIERSNYPAQQIRANGLWYIDGKAKRGLGVERVRIAGVQG